LDAPGEDFGCTEGLEDGGLTACCMSGMTGKKTWTHRARTSAARKDLRTTGSLYIASVVREESIERDRPNYESLGTLKRHTLDSNPDIHEENGKRTNELHVVFN
jgi:hypothetical protein